MSERLAAGTRVEVRRTLLAPGERAPGVPADSADVPYELMVTGLLVAAAALGEEATVVTAIGRRLNGIVERADPADDHSFGRPAPALLAAVRRITEMKRELGA